MTITLYHTTPTGRSLVTKVEDVEWLITADPLAVGQEFHTLQVHVDPERFLNLKKLKPGECMDIEFDTQVGELQDRTTADRYQMIGYHIQACDVTKPIPIKLFLRSA